MNDLQIVAAIANLPINGLLCFAIWKLWAKIEKQNGHLSDLMDKLIDKRIGESEKEQRVKSDTRYSPKR